MKKLIPFLLTLLLFACSGSQNSGAEKVLINPEFSQYVNAFTGGIIPSDGTVKVQFVEETQSKASSVDLEDVFEIYPDIDGEVKWADDRTIEFVPEEPLNSGTLYKVSVDIDEFMTVEEGLETFEFNFRTQRKSFKLEVDRFETYDINDYSRQKLLGKILFSDVVDSSKVKKMVGATQNGKDLNVTIDKVDKYTYRFVVENIIRMDSRSDLEVFWDGEELGINQDGKKSIVIPSKNEFVVLDVEVNHSPEQYVKIHFSDPLSNDQFFEGLVYLKGTDVSVVVDNQVVILYPEDRIVGYDIVKVEHGIKNTKGRSIDGAGSYKVYFEDIAPNFELIGEGNIVPMEGQAHFPFSAVNLTAIDVTITKIYEDNVIQFLQVNNYDGTYQFRRVGREVFRERMELDPDGTMDLSEWNSFSLDLTDYVAMDPGAIYRVQLSARKEYSLYQCSDQPNWDTELTTFEFTSATEEWNERDWDGGYYYSDYYYDYDYWNDYYDYDYLDYKNPCKDRFYENKTIARNVLVSDIGIIAKAGADKRMHVILSDLNTAAPLSGATVKFYDFQQQLLGQTTTDAEGMADMHLNNKPFVVVAEHNGQRGYLKLRDGESLSLSKFDVSGETVQKGIKGFIYAERGVWRPGDSIYVSFMLEDKEDILPSAHPVKFEFINPRGTVVYEKVTGDHVNGLYDFRCATNPEDITGNYTARISVGNRRFYEYFKVESVKPNRLKINLEFAGELLSEKSDRNVNVDVKWLHGATANGLKTKVDVHLSSTYTSFKGLSTYNFDDPLKYFEAEDKTIYEGNLDANGQLRFDHGINLENAAPGMLKAYFTTKVFEKGGEFSINRTSVQYSPYSEYVGIKVPKGSMYGNTLVTDENHEIDFVTVNEKGKPVDSEISVKVYKLEWRWWWDNYDDGLASYISRSSTIPIDRKVIQTKNGRATYDFRIDQPAWGRYLILAENKESGHTTGKIVYVDWPYYARSQRNVGENSTMLAFSTDKEKYTKGETIKLTIPTPEEGRALISLESGTKIIDKFWIDTKKGETTAEIIATEEMDPNVFIHVTLVQPYQNTANDLPIRMYGVVPVYVEDPASHLNPIINMKDVLRPESTTAIQVKEKDNKPMTYTLAIVDEGLLDLTNFQTPDPWSNFYAREALGVKTWDMYDYVLGAYGEELDKLLAIGGDGSGDGKKGAKANRFEPMVEFLGPFEYNGGTNTHKIEIPNYVGSVRVMVVTGENCAYGRAEKTVPVRNPLMVLGTLPRVVGPGEEVALPVDVFAMEKHVKNVSVTVTTNDMFKINGSNKKTIKFDKIGDEIVNFDLTVAERTGIGKVQIVATSGNEKASYDFEIDVRTPNTEQTITSEKMLEGGDSFEASLDYFGIEGTNQAYLEVSNFPPIDLGRRLDYLINYPHGCIEQTTSSVFPQLYLTELMELDANRQLSIQENIKAGIERIRLFQTSNGGFAYWPGGSYDNEWGSNYAGHFLMEAESKGFSVPSGMKKDWISFQKKQAKNWSKANQTTDGPRYDDLIQAYRLFTLALAGKAEIGLMNRLRERNDLSLPARWRLAAAYKLAGQKEVAEDLISKQAFRVPEYVELSYTFGTNTRDEAMILETLVLLGKKSEGAELAKELANRLNNDSWMSTQTTAFALLSVSKFVGENKAEENMKFSFDVDGKSGTRNSEMTMVSFDLGGKTKKVKVKNTGKGILYVRLITKGVPLGGNEQPEAKNIDLTVNYFDTKHRPIDVSTMKQGTDFIAEITVSNPGSRGYLRELALVHIVPSGWEIHNSRMDLYNSNNSSYFTYQDIRDDRIYTYFDIGPNKTKTFSVQLNSSYLGKFYLPGISVEAMYDNSIYARVKGQWVAVEAEKAL